MRWEKKLDILGPIEQAERCLDTWLQEEQRVLAARHRQRAAALMARYFHYEDEMTDELMLSFLRHYSNSNDVDMEDPTSVRMGIKAVLDKSHAVVDAPLPEKKIYAALMAGAMIAAVLFGGWYLSHRTISEAQQEELKSLVKQIVILDDKQSYAGVWADMKEPLGVKRYQDIPWWRYKHSRERLEEKLDQLKHPVTPAKAGV